VSIEDIQHLIGRVYDAALDDDVWPTLAADIPQAFDSTSVVTAIVNNATSEAQFLIQSANFTPNSQHDYETHFGRQDIWAARGAELGLSKVWASMDLVEDDELHRTEYYNDYCRPLGMAYVAGSVWRLDDTSTVIAAVHRPLLSGGYDEDDKQRVGLFMPHLQRALQMRQKLALADVGRQAALDGLERTGTATLVTDDQGRIIFANRLAEVLLREGDAVRVSAGRITALDRSVAERLRFLISGAIHAAAGHAGIGAAGGALAIPRPDRLPLTILVAPFRPAREGFGAASPWAIIFFKDPETPSVTNMTVRNLFGLTASEAGIAAALAEGASVDGLANAFGISLNTVRNHIKSILAKTGARRQAELVALILRSVASMQGPL
jgi:DNA-binding CsgD family transcriptional regulator/PAS domain-containing protein